MKGNSKKEKTFIVIGSLLIIVGILCNKWTLTALLGALVPSHKIMIWVFDIVCILLGCLFVKCRSLSMNIGKFATYYKELATIILNTCLLFLLVNVFIHIDFKISGLISAKFNPVSMKYGLPLDNAYPGWGKESINALLNETWHRPYAYEPYTQFKERPYRGKYVNVDENGFRFVKNQGPWPPDYNNFNIFLFGGSTTFGYGVPDDQTIASYLQDFFWNANFGGKVCVYNFGRAFYFSSQERILYEKLLTSGFTPNIAIFIDGINEFYYDKDEPIYTDRFIMFTEARGPVILKHLILKLPVVKVIDAVKKKFAEKHQEGTNFDDEKYNDAVIITGVINRYVRNKKLIEAASKAFSIKSVFVWQPAPTYKYDLKYHIFADGGFDQHIYPKYGYPYMEKLSKRGDLGDNFLWLADIQENMKKPLYVDKVHYSSELSKIIANNIYVFLMDQIITEAK